MVIERAEGAAANREAAAAARHLATLALLHGRGGMEQALAYSEEATWLAPDDVDVWLLRGLVLWSAGRAAAARDAYRQALDLHPDERDRATALLGIGDASILLGSLADAVGHFERATTAFERRTRAAPKDLQRQRDLSVSLEKIGDVQVARGELPAALGAFEKSLAMAERLAAADSSNSGWQRDLIVSNVKLAGSAEAQGDAAEAARRYRAALEIAEALAGSGRLAPRDAWMVDDLERRLERVSS